MVSRPTGGSQGWHWGHRVRRDSGPTREGCPGHSQSRYGWVGGEMPFKGPGRWPHVQKPGPGSRRRRSSSGSVPRPPPSGWLGRRGGLPSSGYTVRDNGAWSPLLWDAAITRKGTAFPPATCVPHYRTQRSHKMGGERAVSHCAKRVCVCVSVVPHECPLGSPGDTEQCPPGCSYSRRQGCLSPGVQNTPARMLPSGEGPLGDTGTGTGHVAVSVNPRRTCLAPTMAPRKARAGTHAHNSRRSRVPHVTRGWGGSVCAFTPSIHTPTRVRCCAHRRTWRGPVARTELEAQPCSPAGHTRVAFGHRTCANPLCVPSAGVNNALAHNHAARLCSCTSAFTAHTLCHTCTRLWAPSSSALTSDLVHAHHHDPISYQTPHGAVTHGGKQGALADGCQPCQGQGMGSGPPAVPSAISEGSARGGGRGGSPALGEDVFGA